MDELKTKCARKGEGHGSFFPLFEFLKVPDTDTRWISKFKGRLEAATMVQRHFDSLWRPNSLFKGNRVD
ncbi:hypothetical protein ACJKIH_21325 [Brucella pseudogrignonensis]|uniref:hypothetical protein n=1 Tax=Brucella pseudogrignonensis TaxID=419475 RepID=UPI0038B50941